MQKQASKPSQAFFDLNELDNLQENNYNQPIKRNYQLLSHIITFERRLWES